VGISDDIGLAPPRYSSQILKNLTQTMIGGMSAAASRIQDLIKTKAMDLQPAKFKQQCFYDHDSALLNTGKAYLSSSSMADGNFESTKQLILNARG